MQAALDAQASSYRSDPRARAGRDVLIFGGLIALVVRWSVSDLGMPITNPRLPASQLNPFPPGALSSGHRRRS
jgi:hypothetical protein